MDILSQLGTPSLAPVDAIIIIGFLVLVVIVGYMMAKTASKGLDDYFLGGKRIPWWVLGASTATSNFDMAGTMIIVAVVFALGYKGFLVEMRGGVGFSLGFLMVFLGKWLRRSRVMTSAEWMKLRFGVDKQGKAAHILSASANVIFSLMMIVYFSKGAGKFLTHFLPLPEFVCTSVMVVVGLVYTLMSGLYGVVFTDVVQMILLIFTAIYVAIHGFFMRPNVNIPENLLAFNLEMPQGIGESLVAKDPSTWEPIFSMFGLCVLMWMFRSMLEGMGGVGGYTDQRFFSARTEKEASLLTLEAVVIALFRWAMVAGLVVMGYHILQQGGASADIIRDDAEFVLPVVLGKLLPAGIRGFVLAGLVAAAMSTFDSTLNAGASYLVRDIYQSYIKPDASEKDLVRMSRLATIALCVAGVLFAAIVPNINQIWGLVTMGLTAGLFVPLFLRWYWPRFNGYGFTAGTAAGIVAALVFDAFLDWPVYQSFPTILGCAAAASVVATYLTKPIEDGILVRFCVQINPWGGWSKYTEKAREQGHLTEQDESDRTSEKINDVLALCFSVPFQVCILLLAMSFIFHAWTKFTFFLAITVLSGVGLYFFWYRNLKDTKKSEKEDELFDIPPGKPLPLPSTQTAEPAEKGSDEQRPPDEQEQAR
jgi:Na+/proline symporter